jgi:hypothetical protein
MGDLMQKQVKNVSNPTISLPSRCKFPKTKLLIQIEYFPDAVEAIETSKKTT